MVLGCTNTCTPNLDIHSRYTYLEHSRLTNTNCIHSRMHCLSFVHYLAINFPLWIHFLFAVDCLVANCSGNGVCIQGTCQCFHGYQGGTCTVRLLTNLTVYVQDCSQHGVFSFERQSCHCDPGWEGDSCELGRFRGLLQGLHQQAV